jgi:hypothetical protein
MVDPPEKQFRQGAILAHNHFTKIAPLTLIIRLDECWRGSVMPALLQGPVYPIVYCYENIP